jgi:hypothetical protein
MGAKEIKKNKKNRKPVHGVMICDLVFSKLITLLVNYKLS